MSEKKNLLRYKYTRIIAGILAIICMVIIYRFSDAGTEKSGNESRSVSLMLVENVNVLCNLGMGDTKINEMAEAIEGSVRKAAHMIEYGILGVLVCIALDAWKWKYVDKIKPYRLFICLGICAMYAASDEFHQTFIPGRNGCVKDVGIDFIGTLLFVLIATLIICIRVKKEKCV